ncbi:MAG: glycosyltransferase family 39 protein [Gammaproteobacteria bacterium]|nr:glycosyltransferase family 39 protein [Gammaproteobacteria bacterium]
MSSRRRPSLSQLGLLLLCAAWLLPGLVGHAPWKGGDGDHFVQLWLLLQSDVAPQAVSATPPLYYWVATATAWLTSPVLALHDGARLASGLFVALALFFVARTARVLYGAEAGWAAALTLLGCVGLLVRGHELNAYTAQFAAAAIMLYGLASLPQNVRSGWALGIGATLMLLAGGVAEAVLILALAGLLPLLLESYRSPAARRALLWGIGLALAASAAWLAYLATQGIPFVRVLNLQRWLGGDGLRPAYFPGILGWYAWPAWPLAAWGLYRSRRQWRTPGMVLPLGALVGLLGLYALAAHPGEEQGLVLLLPLALLGAAGLLTLRRGAASALLWFALMLFGFIGLVFWVYWSAHDLGSPARLAARLTRLGMTGVGELRPWALALGLVVTLAWIVFLARVGRSPLRPILVWTASMTFIWALLMALFQAPLDRRLSYASVAEELAARVPSAACIQTVQVRSQQRLLLAYHSGRQLAAAAGCDWLLVGTRRNAGEPDIPDGWIKQWEGARAGDRTDRFHLYARQRQ